ncbi:putative toxin-antitoxin system toxin component, PIN family [Terriglobus sp. RCC_193]|uniref:putative toxin-antitoxin system toxin component, PIN family n=1 Tax=Terriglobus sp. RCC_193 TaxID=3239218 RepID=UPI0035232B72
MNRRVVFDTSTLVSAALRIGSVPHQALHQALAAYDLCASPETLQELERVLASNKFDRYLDRSLRDQFVSLMQRHIHLFTITSADLQALNPSCRDPRDDPFLALAVVAEAGTMVSSDEDLLVLHPWHDVDILRPGDFLRKSPLPDKAG